MRELLAWSQFPAGKWGVAPMPVSIDYSQHSAPANESAPEPHVHGAAATDAPTHGSVLNSGKTKEVPWVLELTPMPSIGHNDG